MDGSICAEAPLGPPPTDAPPHLLRARNSNTLQSQTHTPRKTTLGRVRRSEPELGLICQNRTRLACEPGGCMIIARATPAQP